MLRVYAYLIDEYKARFDDKIDDSLNALLETNLGQIKQARN